MIDQALESAYRIEIQRANLNAIPIANLGVSLSLANRVKRPKSEWFNPYPELLKALEIKALINRETISLVLELARDGKIPGWAIAHLDVKLLKLVYTLL